MPALPARSPHAAGPAHEHPLGPAGTARAARDADRDPAALHLAGQALARSSRAPPGSSARSCNDLTRENHAPQAAGARAQGPGRARARGAPAGHGAPGRARLRDRGPARASPTAGRELRAGERARPVARSCEPRARSGRRPRPRPPRSRCPRRGGRASSRGPVGVLVVEVGQLLEQEARPEPLAQRLDHHVGRHGRGRRARAPRYGQAAVAVAPLAEGVLEGVGHDQPTNVAARPGPGRG